MHTELADRLWVRREEIEQAAMARVDGISPGTDVDNEYAKGLRMAISAALDYGLDALILGEPQSRPVPAALLAQARSAARSGVQLETVLRRYLAGYALLRDFLIEEIAREDLLTQNDLRRMLRSQAAAFDHLIAAVAQEHANAANDFDTDRHLAERVQNLLDGVSFSYSDFAYDFNVNHVAVVAAGISVEKAMMQELARALDCRSLIVSRHEKTMWIWLGARRVIDPRDIETRIPELWRQEAFLAIGEPAGGLAGWRLTHQQAQAALPIARRGPRRVVRYGDVALLASIVKDDLLATSLHDLFIAPLRTDRDNGSVLHRTVKAYLSARCNVSSTAASLGVSRQTVRNRLKEIEERLARPLGSCTTEIDAALRLADLRTLPAS